MTNAQAYRDFQSQDIPVIKSPFGAMLDVNTLLKNIHFSKPVPQDELVQFIAVAVRDANGAPSEEALKETVANRLNQEYYPEYMGIKMEEKTYIPPFMKNPSMMFTDSPFGVTPPMLKSILSDALGGVPNMSDFAMEPSALTPNPKDTIKSFLSQFVPEEEVVAAMNKAEELMASQHDEDVMEAANDALMSALIDNYGLTYVQAKEVSEMETDDANFILDLVDRAHKRGREDQKRLQDDEI